MAVEELLQLVRLGREVDALAQLQRCLLGRRPVAAGAYDQEAVVVARRQSLGGQRGRDGVRKPGDVLAPERRKGRDGARVGDGVAIALLDVRRGEDDLVAE